MPLILFGQFESVATTATKAEGHFITKDGIVRFIGGPGGGAGTRGVAGIQKSADNYPSEKRIIPEAVYKGSPPGTFDNVTAGAQMTYGAPPDALEWYTTDNPYQAARRFGAEYWDKPRAVDRVLGQTPVNRFLFKVENGNLIYEVLYEQKTDRFYIVPLTTSPEQLSALSFSGRGKKVPLWSDFTP